MTPLKLVALDDVVVFPGMPVTLPADGDYDVRYRFVIDLDGHILDERVSDALLGLKRFSPNVIFLGSYPRADRLPVTVSEQYQDAAFIEARDWLRGLIAGEPNGGGSD